MRRADSDSGWRRVSRMVSDNSWAYLNSELCLVFRAWNMTAKSAFDSGFDSDFDDMGNRRSHWRSTRVSITDRENSSSIKFDDRETLLVHTTLGSDFSDRVPTWIFPSDSEREV
jgi:hypothetical protein